MESPAAVSWGVSAVWPQLGGVALTGLSWSALSAAEPEIRSAPSRRPLVVKPIFTYSTYKHRPQTSWRPWGGIQTQKDVDEEAVRIMTHFESDYGATPKVEMHKGQRVTMIAPDFAAERWMGLSGEIVDHPFLPICRSQIDVRFEADAQVVAERMPGFHWMLVYGNYLRETGYALKKVPIEWDCLG